MTDKVPIFTVDAFTDAPFTGNPAAVCLLKKPLSDTMYQKIAFEVNLSETAFILPLAEDVDFSKDSKFRLRWFTPTTEVPLCGHATLAAAHVLFRHAGNENSDITFVTLSGPLHCARVDDYIRLDFPELKVAKIDNVEKYHDLVQACVGCLDVLELLLVPEAKKLLVVLNDSVVSRKDLEALKPNAQTLMQSAPSSESITGVCVTLKGLAAKNGCVSEYNVPYDFVSRYFAPWYGIPEDPVTGSIHCALASYWSSKLDKTHLYVRQCSLRGGELRLTMHGNGRVHISGKAKTIITGSIEY